MRAVNLIPAERRTGASVGLGRSHGGAYALLALIGVIALLVVLYGKARNQVASDHSQAAKLTAQAEQAQQSASGLARYNSVISESEARTLAVEQLVDTRFDWARAFHELGRVLPKQISISSLTGTIAAEREKAPAAKSPGATTNPAAGGSSGASGSSVASASSTAGASSSGSAGGAGASSVSSATPPGSVPTFTLTGCATSQPAVAQMLERLRLMEGVKEASLSSSVSATSGGAGGSGTCPGSAPLFTVAVTFQALPAATPKATTSVANTTAGTSSTATGGSR